MVGVYSQDVVAAAVAGFGDGQHLVKNNSCS